MISVEDRVLAALKEAERLKTERRQLLAEARSLREQRRANGLVTHYRGLSLAAPRHLDGDVSVATFRDHIASNQV